MQEGRNAIFLRGRDRLRAALGVQGFARFHEPDNCSTVRRLIRLRPVDDRGRYAGRISVVETFESVSSPAVGIQSLYNSCENTPYFPGRCLGMSGNYFTDQLWVGCASGSGECGFEPSPVVSRWWWCPRNVGNVSLAANVYDIKNDRALVNGRSNIYSPGAWFR